MEKQPHCWGKMFWILDYPVGKEKNICNRCEYGIKTCLRLTREKAETLKTEIENLKEDGKLNVFSAKLKDLFYDKPISKKCKTCGHKLPLNYFEDGLDNCYICS